MSRKFYDSALRNSLLQYSEKRSLELLQFTQWHFRLTDGIYTTIDIWTSRKYYVKETNYHEWAKGTIERNGEKGKLPKKQHAFLDELFFLVSKGGVR